MGWADVLETVGPIAKGMRQGSEQLRATLYDRHLENYIFQQAIEIFEAAMEEAGYDPPRDRKAPAIAFLDMGGYTLLTQKAGDEAAAELAATLAGIVQRASRDYGGEPVKLLGDGVMFHFPQPERAVACGLELVELAERQGLPPAAWGPTSGRSSSGTATISGRRSTSRRGSATTPPRGGAREPVLVDETADSELRVRGDR